MRVLVVEDDAVVRKLVLLSLEHAGYEVGGASGVSEALANLRATRWDAMILDRRLRDGRAEEIIKEYPRLPAVVITGHPEEPSDIQKPFTRDQLLSALLDKLNSRA